MDKRGEARKTAVLNIGASLDELRRIHDFFDCLAQEAGWPERLKMDLLLSSWDRLI